MSLDEQPYVNHIAYNAKGQRTLIAYGNKVMTRYAYDVHTFKLVHLLSERYSQPGILHFQPENAPLQDFAYTYDLAGNILSIRDQTPGSGILNTLLGQDVLHREFTYDPLYRLLSATGRECDQPALSPPWLDEPHCTDATKTRPYTEIYQYDKANNIAQLRHVNKLGGFTRNFALVSGNNRLSKVTIGDDSFIYSYDGNGNIIQEGFSRHFDWDYADQLKSFRTQTEGAEASVHAQYLYDAAGQRVKKLVRKQSGQAEATVYIDGAFEYQSVTKLSGKEVNNTLHVMDDQSRIAQVRVGKAFSDDVTPAIKFQLSDHLGSSSLVIDLNGIWINSEEFTPYGETSFGGFSKKRYRFTGREWDEESGLNYHGARYYAPWLGRWMSCDPIGTVDGLNLYCFARNNPMRFTDFFGTDSSDAVKCPGGNCHVSAPEDHHFSDLPPPLSENEAQSWLTSSPPLEDHALPSSQEQGAGKLPSRFNIQCVGNCHDPSKVQGNWIGIGPAPDNEPVAAAKVLVTAVTLLPGPGTLTHALQAVDQHEKGQTGKALWSLAGAALTLAPFTSATVRSQEAAAVTEAKGYNEALAARDDIVRTFKLFPNTDIKGVATVVGGYNRYTGEVTVGTKWFQTEEEAKLFRYCAEDVVDGKLGGFPFEVIKTPAIRPVGLKEIPVCLHCQLKSSFSPSNFGPGTRFQ